jgi:flagellar basal body-associated protein FliL
MNKKAIISIVAAAALTITAAFGTYAWFTSSVPTRTNSISTGTLALSSEALGQSHHFDLNVSNAQPGDVLEPIDFTITNTGSLGLSMFRKFTLSPDAVDLAKAIVLKEITLKDWSGDYGKTELMSWGTLDGNPSNISLYDLCNMNWQATGAGFAALYMRPGDYQKLHMVFELDKNLTVNTMQGKTVSASMDVWASQTNPEAIRASLEGKGVLIDNSILVITDQVNRIRAMFGSM